MKNLITMMFLVLFGASSICLAETTVAGNYALSLDERRDFTNEEASVVTERLGDFEMSAVDVRMDDLERRVQSLERDKKFSEDKIRSLERQVNDLRRRRV